MTTTTPAATAAPTRLITWITPIGPLAMAGWAFTIPYQTSDELAVWIPDAAAATGRLQIAMLMLLLCALTATVGTLVTGLMARRASRKLGTTGLVLTFLSFGGVTFGGAGYDAAAVATYNTVHDTATTERALDEYESFVAPMLATALFVPLLAVGVILMGIAFWRGRTIPRWAAGAMLGAFPVIVLGGFVSTAVMAIGWLLLAAAFGSAGAAYAHAAHASSGTGAFPA
ncbi:hypothetical protein OG216_47205 (plasmid) [Streptomycetaceae bacterium NBC_01309]